MEIIPKPEQKNIFGSNTPFVAAVLLLAFAAGSFLTFWQLQAKSKKTIASLESQLALGGTKEQKKVEQQVLAYQRKIGDFKSFVSSRQDASRFFQFLEHYTHPKVFFKQVNLNVKDGFMILEGEASDFTTLDEQLLVFRERNEIDKATLSNVNIGENGRVVFALELTFSQKIFQ